MCFEKLMRWMIYDYYLLLIKSVKFKCVIFLYEKYKEIERARE